MATDSEAQFVVGIARASGQDARVAQLDDGVGRQLLRRRDCVAGSGRRRQALQRASANGEAAGQQSAGCGWGDAPAPWFDLAELEWTQPAADPRRDAPAKQASMHEVVGSLSQAFDHAAEHLLCSRSSADADAEADSLDAASDCLSPAAGRDGHAAGRPGPVLADDHSAMPKAGLALSASDATRYAGSAHRRHEPGGGSTGSTRRRTLVWGQRAGVQEGWLDARQRPGRLGRMLPRTVVAGDRSTPQLSMLPLLLQANVVRRISSGRKEPRIELAKKPGE